MEARKLEAMVASGATLAQLAAEFGVDRSTVRRWLRRHALETRRMAVRRENAAARGSSAAEVLRSCSRHGLSTFRLDARGTYRCSRCNSERVSRRRRRVKEILVAEAGGRCLLCGYDRCMRALEFHHVDRATKTFNVALRGVTRSLEPARAEASKCVLLCSNCHMEVEAGVVSLP